MNLGKVNIWGNSCRHIASRLAELDELHLSIQKVSGYTVEQLLQMFLAGCEMKRPEYPSIEEIEKARYSYMMHEMSLLHRAIAKYGKPLVVLDFGTATTYDLITEKGEFAAGITAPGMGISSEALWTQAAKLPKIEIRKPKTILAQETISSMQAGLVYGQIGQTEYIIRKVKEESGLKKLKVVATGGLGRLIAQETEAIDIYDSHLTMEGLRILYEKNRKPAS